MDSSTFVQLRSTIATNSREGELKAPAPKDNRRDADYFAFEKLLNGRDVSSHSGSSPTDYQPVRDREPEFRNADDRFSSNAPSREDRPTQTEDDQRVGRRDASEGPRSEVSQKDSVREESKTEDRNADNGASGKSEANR